MADGGIDVFLSYNSADRAAVERIATRLRAERVEPWLDQWNITPGGRWQQEIADGLRAARACAVFVGPSGLGDWAREELGVAQDRAAKDHDFRVFMVLLPGAPDPLDTSLAFLRTRSWVDLRSGIADSAGFQDLICAITGVPSPRASVGETDVCPYRGLEAFQEEHAEFFFGRGDDVKRVVEKLKHTRFLGVLGPSGSGKSSLVRAGVLPALKAGALPGSDTWPMRVFTPGAQPLSALAAQVVRLFPQESMQRTLDELRQDQRTLDLAVTLALADRPHDEHALFFVDQFEELFTICTDEQQRAQFLANLLHAATMPGGRLVLVIGMRADFYHRCAKYPELRSLISAEQYLVGPLDTEGLREAIEEPARRVGLEPEPGLVKTILDDVADRPGTLPLLEHVLLELWEKRRGRMLTLEAYVANGGVEGALAGRANSIYESLSTAQQELARRVLLRLVQPGEGAEDTRRRAAVAELVARPEQQADVDVVVRALADQRLLTTGRDDVSGAQVVDITHEALIRGWPELRRWINEDREALRAHRRLTEAALEWDHHARDPGLLYRGARLAYWQERDLNELNDLELAFLSASRREAARELAAGRRRVRLAVLGLVSALLVISTVAVLAVQAGRRATERAAVALSGQLAANARARLGVDPELALLLAREAYRAKPTAEASSILRQATMESRVRAAYRGHEGPVYYAAFSADAQHLVSAGKDGTVRVWDRQGTTDPVVLRGHDGAVSTAAFSPDGQKVLSAGSDKTVRVWDRRGAADPVILRGHEDSIITAFFDPEGRRIASASLDGTVRVWDRQGNADPLVLRQHEGGVLYATFSRDGRLLTSAGQDGTVRVWDLAGGADPVIVGNHGTSAARAAGFSPDGRRVVSAGDDRFAWIWDREGGQPPVQLLGTRGAVWDGSFSPDGRLVVGAGEDGDVRVWDWTSVFNAAPLLLRGHHGPVRSAAFSPDGRFVVSAGDDGSVRVWEPGLVTFREGEAALTHAAFSPDGGLIASTDEDGTVRVWDWTSGAGSRVLGNHGSGADNAAFSPDGRRVVSTSFDEATVWDLAGNAEPVVLRAPEGAIFDAAFSPDGRRVVTASSDGMARIWELDVRGEPVVLEGEEALYSAAFSPDGRLVVIAGQNGTVRVWEWESGRQPQDLSGHEGLVESAAFSPDGRWVVSAGGDGTVRVWDRAGKRPPVVLRGHPGDVRTVVFSPDGRVVVSSGDDTARVWVWASAEQPLVLLSPSFIYAADLRPDGRMVLGAGHDGLRIWACEVCGPIEEVLALSGSRVTRRMTPAERATYLHEDLAGA